MKLQWLKDILGDSYTEEQDAKVCTALGERFVARTDFNDKVSKLKEAEAQVTQLNAAVKTRDTQLEELGTTPSCRSRSTPLPSRTRPTVPIPRGPGLRNRAPSRALPGNPRFPANFVPPCVHGPLGL